MRSRSCLLIWPITAFAGLIRRHVGLMAKLGLWSLRVMNASRFAVVLILSSRCSFFSTLGSSSMVLVVTWVTFLVGLGDVFLEQIISREIFHHIEKSISSFVDLNQTGLNNVCACAISHDNKAKFSGRT